MKSSRVKLPSSCEVYFSSKPYKMMSISSWVFCLFFSLIFFLWLSAISICSCICFSLSYSILFFLISFLLANLACSPSNCSSCSPNIRLVSSSSFLLSSSIILLASSSDPSYFRAASILYFSSSISLFCSSTSFSILALLNSSSTS